MVKVVSDERFIVYVYDEYGVRHNRPHCQVRWAGEDAQVALPSLDVLAGVLPRAALRLLEDNLDTICDKWDELNPRRTIG
jgi:hypothetical protein